MFFSRPLRFLREADPGLLRLTQACKTLGAVVVSLCLFWRASPQTRMFAAAGSAYIMQCSSAGPLRRRQLTMLIVGLAMAAVVGLAVVLKGHHWFQDLLIVSVAALAYYFRRFLLDKNQFPIFGFVLCVLAAVLSTGWQQGLHDMLAVATGIPLAFGIYFFILPPDPVSAARDELRDFCLDAAAWLNAPPDRRRFEALASRPAFLKGVADNQPDHAAAPRIGEAVSNEYALLESLLVLVASTPGRPGPGLPTTPGPKIISEPNELLNLPAREAAQLIAARSAANRLDSLQAKLANAATSLAARPEGRAS